MTTSTMDVGRGPAPETGDTSGLKNTAIALFYLVAVGAAFTALLSLGLVVAFG